MIDRSHDLPVFRQCQILELARSTAYYVPQPTSPDDLALIGLWKSIKYEEVYLKAYDSVPPPRSDWAPTSTSTTPAGRISHLTAIRRMRFTSPVCRRKGSQYDDRVTHRAACLRSRGTFGSPHRG